MSCSRLHVLGDLCHSCDFGYKLEQMRDQGILTVGELRRWLVGLDDETQVLIGSSDGGYLNIDDAILPDGENYQALTLFGADTYDSRQF